MRIVWKATCVRVLKTVVCCIMFAPKCNGTRFGFFNVENERISKPPTLAGYNCNVLFHIKGKWASHGQVGLSVEVSDIQLLEPDEADYKSPFL